MITRTVLIAIAVVAMVVVPSRADVVNLVPVSDNTLFEEPSGSLSNGGGQYLFAGRTNQADGFSLRRGLVRFNVAGAIPSGATITDVALTMNMSRTIEGATLISLHRVLADWGEGTADASGQEGTGASADPGDATWLHRFSSSSLWTAPGGDFTASASASAIVVGLGPYTWTSTPALLADVIEWRNNPAGNYGWLVHGEESLTGTAKRFDSRETPTATDRPVLTITYDPPPVPAASTWGLVAMTILLGIAGTVLLHRHPIAN